ncbi:hypothetical protein D3C86_1881480 [compost metagenome]
MGKLENRRLLILVDRDNDIGMAHADGVLHRARDADGEVELRPHRGARLPHLMLVGDPSRINGGAGRANDTTERVR